jgi:hypothetical protein
LKVIPLSEASRFLNRVHEKGQAGGDQSGRRGQQQDSQKKKEEEAGFQRFDVTDEKVQAAITDFKTDSMTQAQGLNAEVEGQGFGLRVVLKDGRGAVVRQFTGEEFLKLREVARDGRKNGKILDQKF